MSNAADPKGIITKLNVTKAVRLWDGKIHYGDDVAKILGAEKMDELKTLRAEQGYTAFMLAVKQLVIDYDNMDPYEANSWENEDL